VTITVLVIIGYFIVSTFQPKEALALQQAERLRNDVRHMQMLALTWNTPLRLTTAAGSYQVCCLDTATSAACLPALPVPPAPCAVPDPIVDPATGRPFQVALEPGLTLAGPPGVTLNIDGLGRPANGAALLTVNAIYTINGASIGRTVTVAPLTGFAIAQ
jgi:hypothetical protein